MPIRTQERQKVYSELAFLFLGCKQMQEKKIFDFFKKLTPQTTENLIQLAREHRIDEEKMAARIPFKANLTGSHARRMLASTNPTYLELFKKIKALSKSEKSELLALAWVGQGKAGVNPVIWSDLVAAANTEPELTKVHYLATLELLDVYLKEGLTRLNH